MPNTADIYTEITQQFIDALKENNPPWLAPWKKTGLNMDIPYNFTTGEQYHGINILRFWLHQLRMGYSAPAFATVKQANALKCRVKKLEGFEPPPDKPHATGQRAIMGIRVGTSVKEIEDREDPEVFSWLKTFYVLNIDQFVVPEEVQRRLPLPGEFNMASSRFHDLLRDLRVKIVRGQFSSPHYRGGNTDTIYMLESALFNTKEDEEASLAHELIHWTGHKKRLNRFDNGDEEFGGTPRQDYAFEELVAEIGASFLCVRYGIDRTHVQHENYIQGWLKLLKNDSRAVVKAAARAQVAVDFLLKEAISDEQATG